MMIWPESATMSEAGTQQAGSAPTGGGGGMMGGGGGMGMLSAPNAGEIMLNRAESAALAALETENDSEHGIRRASAESGLSRQQVKMLQRRAAAASTKGYTLKGPGFIKKPLGAAPDEPGLTRSSKTGDDSEMNPKKPAAKKLAASAPPPPPTGKVVEGALLVRAESVAGDDLYHSHLTDGYRLPTPHSASEPEGPEATKETNSQSVLAAMLNRKRRKRY